MKNVENEIKLCETKLQDEQEKIKKYKVIILGFGDEGDVDNRVEYLKRAILAKFIDTVKPVM